MATAYFVGLKKNQLYYQYLGNATPITIKIATTKKSYSNIHHSLDRNYDRAFNSQNCRIEKIREKKLLFNKQMQNR